ncbi:MAG: PDZ domain-containing protein [Phycisphaerae bacterium]
MTYTPWRSGIWRTVLFALALCTPAFAAESAPDIDTQYQHVLAEMKHPTATGILITEIEPDSPAGAAGLQAGDILYHYAGSNVRDLDTLRKRVADQIASALTTPIDNNPNQLGGPDNKVLLGVRRAGKDIILQVPRTPLGIRAIEVEAGVPAPLNPPPSPRGSLALAWNDLAHLRTADTPPDFYRTTDTTDTWTSWQRREFLAGADDLSASFENHHVDPNTGETLAAETLHFHLRTGDSTHTPAFLLDSLDKNILAPNGVQILGTAERHGLTLRTQGKRTFPTHAILEPPTDHPGPIDALPEPALPLVAAALPHDPNAALPLHLLSIQDFIPRPGYLLIARGQHPRPIDGHPNAWQVDLLHCGVIVQTYWFDDHRLLLELDAPLAGLTSRRVLSQKDATTPAAPKPTTQPTTNP